MNLRTKLIDWTGKAMLKKATVYSALQIALIIVLHQGKIWFDFAFQQYTLLEVLILLR